MSGLNQLQSRFIVDTDERVEHMIYDLPKSWWSRPYEYAWCSSFVSDEAVVLDAACGISHPFKFFLAEHCKMTYACDLDPRILSTESILKNIRDDIGVQEAEAAEVKRYTADTLALAHANLTSLPYENDLFDLIFCISVLEHMPVKDCVKAMEEFKRTLKPDGKLILTFDYPTVNLNVMDRMFDELGLEYADQVDYALPDHAVHSKMWGSLYIFRAVLRKRA